MYACVCVYKLCHFHDYNNSFSLHFFRFGYTLFLQFFCQASFTRVAIIPLSSSITFTFSFSLSLSLSTFVSRARSFRSSFFSLCTDCELRINDKLRPNLRYDSVFFFFILYRVFLFKGKSENLKALSFLVSRLCIYIYVRLVSCTTIVQEFILIEITWIISNMIYI